MSLASLKSAEARQLAKEERAVVNDKQFNAVRAEVQVDNERLDPECTLVFSTG